LLKRLGLANASLSDPNAGIEHLVGHREGVGDGSLLVRHPEQVLVRIDGWTLSAALMSTPVATTDTRMILPPAGGGLTGTPIGRHSAFAASSASSAAPAGHRDAAFRQICL
jgi:hypothetical protein